jgi:putative peptidoglycan lipid II flippase
MLPVVLGLSLPGVYAMILRKFGAQYADPSTVAHLEFANILNQAPLGVFGQSLAIAVFPVLSQFYAQKEMGAYREQLLKTMRQALYLSLPVSTLFVVAPLPIVTAIYQQGRFGAGDALAVAGMLRWCGVGVWAWCLHPILMRGFFAVQNTVTPIVLGTVTTAIFLALVFLFRTLSPNDPNVLLAASSTAAIGLAGMLLVFVRRSIGEFDVSGLVRTFGKSALASLAFALVTWGLLELVGERMLGHGKLAAVAALGIVTLPGIAVYGWATHALKMPEAVLFDRAMARFRR